MRQAEFAISDRYFEEYDRVNKKPPAPRRTRGNWKARDGVPSTFYLQAAAIDGCDVHYILTGRKKENA